MVWRDVMAKWETSLRFLCVKYKKTIFVQSKIPRLQSSHPLSTDLQHTISIFHTQNAVQGRQPSSRVQSQRLPCRCHLLFWSGVVPVQKGIRTNLSARGTCVLSRPHVKRFSVSVEPITGPYVLFALKRFRSRFKGFLNLNILGGYWTLILSVFSGVGM